MTREESELFQIGRAIDIFAVEMKSALHEIYKDTLEQPHTIETENTVMNDVLSHTLEKWNPETSLEKQEEIINEALIMFLLWCRDLPFAAEEEYLGKQAACC